MGRTVPETRRGNLGQNYNVMHLVSSNSYAKRCCWYILDLTLCEHGKGKAGYFSPNVATSNPLLGVGTERKACIKVTLISAFLNVIQ